MANPSHKGENVNKNTKKKTADAVCRLQKALEERGLHRAAKVVGKRIDPEYIRFTLSRSPASFLNSGFLWSHTPEGRGFWGRCHNRLLEPKDISLLGKISGYAVLRYGKRFKVGCQYLSERKMLEIWKAVGECLGYEIQG